MGNAIAEPSPLFHKDRRGWLIAFGIIEILFGAASLLMATLTIVFLLVFNPLPGQQMPSGTNTATVVVSVIYYSLVAAFFFTAGIGSIQRRNWARILMLIVSALWLGLGVLSTAFMIFLFPKIMESQSAAHSVPTHAEHAIIVGIVAVVAFLGILLPLVFLIFYSRKSVKATCLAREAMAAPAEGEEGKRVPAEVSSRGLPALVIVIVIWELIGATSVLGALASPVRVTVLFGYIVHGWKTIAIMVFFSALSAAAARLAYKRKMAGWNIAFAKLLFFGASAAVSLASGSFTGLISEIARTPEEGQIFQLFPHFLQIVIVVTLVTCTAYLILLMISRKYFVAPSEPAPVA